MLPYPAIDPVAVSFGPVRLHWYGVMYIAAFLAAWLLGRCRAARPGSGWTADQVDDLATWAMLGVVLGARLGYILFYDLDTYLADPLEVFRVWNGGMSFHGGLVGVLSAALWWSLRHKKRFLDVTDFVAPLVPPGLFFGRLGNFINGELWGKVTTVDWGMVFPGAGELPRHPTQLYEAGLEGLLLFTILWVYSRKPRPLGAVSGLFAVLYALCRIGVEFFRLPDPQLGYLFFGWVTMGQVLCLPLLLAGVLLLAHAAYEKRHPSRDRVVLDDGSVVWIKRR
ncbi:MAG TPA: prolipoprotein diacylglyceryl transferase [Candidatus Mailhella merdigallinarum]|uniref:Phosphatidylglycerol--prolipoprotein diacylglyceryl transferase n=1 Tax=Candidatus Mailhella merdigallinarum TaxID=2838658 RepID=A0A9D2HAR9_9BACT|nr:prolipoprotein diacylglyceryl transferase [Desulfovibrionaceae bacterium]HJA07822.1 prolipoprotein diacylglyceryl transferase [Candidatus Mailhella merdigallinarum]